MEPKIYKSKVDNWLLIVTFGPLLIPTFFLVIQKEWLAVSLMLIIILFITHLMVNTYYCIVNGVLNVKGRLLVNKKLDISKITKVISSRSLLSAPALSLDRLEVFTGKWDSILISPKDKEGFIRDLLARNSEIELELKVP